MTNPKPSRGAGPLFTRLTRAGRVDDVTFLARLVMARAPANDNVPSSDDMGVDSVMEIRPTPAEIAAAGPDGLRYDTRNRLVAWRQMDAEGEPVLDKDGQEIWLKPTERYRHSKGGRRKSFKAMAADEMEHGRRVLSLAGVGPLPPSWVPDTRYASEGAAFEQMEACQAAQTINAVWSKRRRELASLGVSGDFAFDEARANAGLPPGQRGPTVIARGAEFIAGKVDKSGTATEGSFVGAPDASEAAMIAKIDADAVSAKIPEVLGLALDGSTAKEIAESNGWLGKQGERRAVLEIDAAIAQLRRAA